MSLATKQINSNKHTTSLNAIPEILYENWDIDQYYRITNRHIVASATQRKTGCHRVLTIIPDKYFCAKLWKTLIRLPDNKLLLPRKIHAVQGMHILEFLPCTPLKKLVQKQGLSLNQIISLIQDLTSSLQCLHNAGILHMDISVDNVYMTEEQHFILGDFSESCYQRETVLPQKHQLLHYPAPECKSKPPSVFSEQYQLAILFYQLCNNGNVPPKDFCGIIPKDLPALQSTSENSDSIRLIMEKMLAQDPAKRYPDLLSVQKNLESLSPLVLEQSNYRLFLPDESLAFHQTRTQLYENIIYDSQSAHLLPLHLPTISLPSISFSPLMVLSFLISLCLICFLLSYKKFSTTRNGTQQMTSSTKAQITTGNAFSSNEELPINTSTTLDIAHQSVSSLTSIDLANWDRDQIHTLLAENNHISSLNNISFFPNLREVYLSDNQISDLHDLASLSNLEVVILSDNDCTNLSGLNALHKLEFLDLSGNLKLMDISELYTLTSLETVILSDTSVNENSIKQLKQDLPKCNIIF